MANPNRECPRYERCNVNNCPLDMKYPERCIDNEDKEKVCSMEKNVRIRISGEYPGVLKYGGLKQREYSAKLRESNMSEEDKQKRADRVKNYLFVSADKSKDVI